jgi:hypothetical protein
LRQITQAKARIIERKGIFCQGKIVIVDTTLAIERKLRIDESTVQICS